MVHIRRTILNKMKCYPAFFQKVWRACAAIPAGETRTYLWIARKIGKPGSARAVGRALAQNPFAPIIPCHRVIKTDGTLGGYAGKYDKKKERLLQKEREIVRKIKKSQVSGERPKTKPRKSST